jgi:hypothetical protein
VHALHFVTHASIVLALAGGGRADDKAPDEKTGLQVGAKAPAFTLKHRNGKQRTLEEFLKKGKVALVFWSWLPTTHVNRSFLLCQNTGGVFSGVAQASRYDGVAHGQNPAHR